MKNFPLGIYKVGSIKMINNYVKYPFATRGTILTHSLIHSLASIETIFVSVQEWRLLATLRDATLCTFGSVFGSMLFFHG